MTEMVIGRLLALAIATALVLIAFKCYDWFEGRKCPKCGHKLSDHYEYITDQVIRFPNVIAGEGWEFVYNKCNHIGCGCTDKAPRLRRTGER